VSRGSGRAWQVKAARLAGVVADIDDLVASNPGWGAREVAGAVGYANQSGVYRVVRRAGRGDLAEELRRRGARSAAGSQWARARAGEAAARREAFLEDVEFLTETRPGITGTELAARFGISPYALHKRLTRAGRPDQARKLMRGCWVGARAGGGRGR
jgi:hypothetical protein